MTFKYFMHENQSWPETSIKWEEIKPKSYDIQVTDFDSALEYLKDEWRVYDCDSGRERDYYVAITDGKEKRYYHVNHDFSWAYEYDEDDNFVNAGYVDNVYEVNQITKEEAFIPDDRDWLDIGKYNYKLKKWPPQ